MLDKCQFVLKGQAKLFSSKKSYEIVDGETAQPLGTAKETTGFLAGLFGSATIEVRRQSDNALVCSVCRRGFPFKKVQVLDPQGQVVGSYKAKLFSLAGGFHIYDKDGKHFAEIKGRLFKNAFTFVRPDGKTEMGSVSRKWGGLAKELFTSAGTFGVQTTPACADDPTAKMLILGGALAIQAILQKKKKKAVVGSEDGDEESDGEE